MSLSWSDEKHDNHGLAPLNKFKYTQAYGKDIQLETNADDEFAPFLNRSAPLVEDAPSKPQEPVATAYQPHTGNAKKKSWLLRPVAWLAHMLLSSLVVLLVRLALLLAAHGVHKLSSAPTISVIIVTLLFGGIILGIFTSGFIYLPMFLLSTSEAIYPSSHGFRYYFVSVIGLFFNIVAIVIAVIGSVDADFWYYAEAIYLAILHISLMLIVKAEKQ